MRKQGGFTLVELIAVIIILGILAAVGIPQYRRAMERARGAEAYSGLANIQEAEKIYYVSNEQYYDGGDTELSPDPDQKALDISLPQTGWSFGITGVGAATFTVTATRKAGPCSAAGKNTIVYNQAGPVSDAWKTCVDAL